MSCGSYTPSHAVTENAAKVSYRVAYLGVEELRLCRLLVLAGRTLRSVSAGTSSCDCIHPLDENLPDPHTPAHLPQSRFHRLLAVS